MILEQDERPLHRTRLGTSLGVGLPFMLASALLAVWRGELWPAVGTLVALVALGLVALFHRKQLLTDRSLIAYSPLLVALARRFPRLARMEARNRRVIRLSDVMEAKRAGSSLLLRPRMGRTVFFPCTSDQDAADLLRSLEGLLRTRGPQFQRPLASATTSGPVAVRVVPSSGSAEGGGTARCPYCHDEVPEEEAEACERCGVVHHAECLDVHGGCAAFACQGQERARARVR